MIPIFSFYVSRICRSVAVCVVIVFCGFYFFHHLTLVHASAGSQIKIEILTLCGNNIIESGEQCDGSNLGGLSCQQFGFSGGALSCTVNCTVYTGACTSNIPSGGGGGGGSGISPPPVVTQVVFAGRAYPLSKVHILKDGQIAVTTITGPDANFLVSLSGLASGNYVFGVAGEDEQGRRSSMFTFPVFITQGATTQVSGIFVSPTIAVDKSQVKRGDVITIFGQSTPLGDITIVVNSPQEFFNYTQADANGVYLYQFNTALLEEGGHSTKSRVQLASQISSFSAPAIFSVGDSTILEKPSVCPKLGDVNNNCGVNLVDFSIVAYWYKRPNPPTQVDLNGDGKVDIVDFSILAFYWTG